VTYSIPQKYMEGLGTKERNTNISPMEASKAQASLTSAGLLECTTLDKVKKERRRRENLNSCHNQPSRIEESLLFQERVYREVS
jgi:hypothetical protein